MFVKLSTLLSWWGFLSAISNVAQFLLTVSTRKLMDKIFFRHSKIAATERNSVKNVLNTIFTEFSWELEKLIKRNYNLKGNFLSFQIQYRKFL